ncbi:MULTISPECIES: aminotransferase class I/II-fold pyridoxal phosphate-dependent enzyme [Ensifer]|uniref:Aminotransferase class I/II-fold pyridoxal phosphate-dependent enzyme n=1 Tax=Ensifer adhaerens TaxID=106592 RepID=A0ABY8HFU8_ENSAD|nr:MULTISPECIES: aminotransferase class I/II-fold pyridoxal phosphate-dependent enzyme [Ensifer]ANK71348.1 8-amino-7-oxononanoate synthase [Ensifer adhaerens]KDP73742.1 8-amino-7-oxononanoate synthase [Ensifer adhaerens]KQX24040.1 8-amino-7-oxononanoate synthase [Ensifer sp. Root423]KQZ51611.1 8-amino-7-oxononanoate synthase [Ensifer sp. Root558]MBD9538642.1 aminotransferase class I/II-fold pyridoxal phosphate-dependent enzyme [Ensifer sp. ENS04]
MSTNGNGPGASKMTSSLKENLLDRMRNTHQSSERNRMARSEREMPPPARRQQARFEDLPEYKQVMTQKFASEQLGIANPFYRAHQTAAGATTVIDGRKLINFASYDYLGLNRHAEVLARARDTIGTFGISASASRLVAGERPVHVALEEKIADFYGVDAAVCFVSGYLTNVAAISCLMGPKDLVVHDEFIHNSALAGVKLSGATRRLFKHNDVADLEHVLRTVAGDYRRIMVIVEGIYSMDGDVADLPALLKLRAEYGFWLMVDEAHSLGVLGKTGRGLAEHFGVDPREIDIWMGTLSKTTSSCGGYIAGSEALVEVLKASAGGFVYSVGLAPVLAAAATTSLEVLEREPTRTAALRRNGALFLKLAKEAGLDTGLSSGFSVVPVLVGDSLRAVQLSNDLLAEGVNALPIIHPAVPEGLARLRFFITSDHTEEQIRRTVTLTAERLADLTERNFGLGGIDIDQMMKALSAR